MRFHVLGLSHTQTTKEFSPCAFTQKARLLCKMLHERGHYVIHYGVEGSDPQCSELVDTVPRELFDKVHRSRNWHEGFLLKDLLAAHSNKAWLSVALEDTFRVSFHERLGRRNRSGE